MTILYACFDTANDAYLMLGTATSEEAAEQGAVEHGLLPGTYYVHRAVPIVVNHTLQYEPEPSIGVCTKCGIDLFLNDWDLDGVCLDCMHDGTDPNCDHSCGYELEHATGEEHCYLCGHARPKQYAVTDRMFIHADPIPVLKKLFASHAEARAYADEVFGFDRGSVIEVSHDLKRRQ